MLVLAVCATCGTIAAAAESAAAVARPVGVSCPRCDGTTFLKRPASAVFADERRPSASEDTRGASDDSTDE